MRAYGESDDHDFRLSVASVLAWTGVRDERAFALERRAYPANVLSKRLYQVITDEGPKLPKP